MKNLLTWIKENPIRSMFLVPIFLVAGISISHVVAWYDITNPFSWAIYLSVAIEIGAITALIAATQKIKGGVWFMFGVVTFVQMIGNIFYSYKEIDPNGELFIAWVELMSPIFELFGTEPTDIIAHKRWLAILSGGLLPIISLTSLHFFVKYEKTEEKIIENDRDLEIVSLMDLETTLEKEEQEEDKPKSKRGRKRKEVVEEQPKVENKEVELPEPTEPFTDDEIENFWFNEVETSNNEETKENVEDEIILGEIEGDINVSFGEVITEELTEKFVNPFNDEETLITTTTKKPQKLTYTKKSSNVSWSKL
jgi:hypothetical protein